MRQGGGVPIPGGVPGVPGVPGAPSGPSGMEDPPAGPEDLAGDEQPDLTDLSQRGDAELGGTGDQGALTDQNGNPLPVDQLPPLQNCATPGPQVVRRLTAEQYQNTLVAVFGDNNVPDSNPLIDADTLGYNIDADDNLVQGLDATQLNTLAEEVAANARANNFFQGVANCNQNNGDCQRRFVQNLGERISREPLDDERVNRFVDLFNARGDDGTQLVGSFDEGAELVATAMAQSPYLLYRREIGQDMGNGEFQLSGFEVASELSYFLTNAPPDQELFEAARSNQLTSAEGIEAQLQRLLNTQQAQQVLGEFVLRWLDTDDFFTKVKDGGDIPESLRDAMLQETERLFLDVMMNGGEIGELFSADYTFVNQDLAAYYGIEGVGGQDFQRVELQGLRPRGVLGHAAYLAEHALVNNSSPVQRAFVVRERLLCNALPDPPNDLNTNLDPQQPAATSRERYAQHSANDVCRNCHQFMDPIGFAFENYDAFGLFRDQEAGRPIDSSGALSLMSDTGPMGIEVPLNGIDDLSNHLSQSEQARACMVNNLSYFAYGIANADKWSASDKVCNDHAIRQVARDSGNTLRSVLSGIVTAPHFTRRVQSI